MIKVADGEWEEGQVLYFYDTYDGGKSYVTWFVPRRVDTICSSVYFLVAGSWQVYSEDCYLNSDNAVAHALANRVARMEDLRKEMDMVQYQIDKLSGAHKAKIDELE